MGIDQTVPWYRRTVRWGQTNLNELDPTRYDGEWWRQHWRRTRVQGLVVNAGGIVAYYPSRYELHYRAEHLGERDLFGEIVHMAREEGLAILARMDSNRALPAFYRAHPDWFTVNAEGQPSITQGRYQACVNSPYTKEYLPGVLREIIERYHPEGFTDNSWTGMGRRWICHCPHCVEKFGRETGLDLPREVDWTDPVYRRWIKWSYACRIENWELNNRVCREHGGPDCLWLGMINGDPIYSHLSFCDLKEVGARAEMLMSDQQSRKVTGFEQNGVSGKLLHGVLCSGTGTAAGRRWDVVIPESMATYVRGEQAFRKAANPPLETRKWMVEGFAGGISPWWHHIGAYQWDRRQFHTAEPLMRWHEANEPYLYHRRPVANVGLLWSHENIDFYGRDDSQSRVLHPWHGYTTALTRARIPFLPVHADHVDLHAQDLALLILPDLGAMSEAQCQAVRRYVEGGGSVVASANSGRYDEWGEPRTGSLLSDLLGIRHTGVRLGVEGQHSSSWEVHSGHTYLRLASEEAARHPIVAGFNETDILAFGGTLQQVELLPGAQAVATYVPAFPIYPPEFSWMRVPETDIPAIVAREHPSGGRVVYLAADVDRCYGRRGLPDHGDLLANAVRWAARDATPLRVDGPGYVDCHLYRQDGRLILHLINLSGCNAWPAYLEEHLPVGPLRVSVRLDGAFVPRRAQLRVAGTPVDLHLADGWATIELPTLVDHELIVFE
jgi:hypothetical protein